MTATPTHKPTAAFVLVLSAVTALQPLSLDMYMPAMPTIEREFGVETSLIQMTLSIAMFGNALGMIVIGPASDRFGRRAPAMAGLFLYIVGCVGCAMASSVGWLIAMRFLQAFAVVGGVITTRSILSDLFEPREMARSMATLSLVIGVAPIIAPLIGGFVLIHLGWRAIFWILAGCGVVAGLAALLVLPETRTREAQANSRLESPLRTYGALLRKPRLMRFVLSGGFATAVFLTYLVNAANLIISQFHVRPELFGFYFGANALGLMIAHQINRLLLRRFEPGQILLWSLRAVLFFALLLLGLAVAGFGKWVILFALFMIVACFPFNVVNATASAQGEDRARGGAVAAMYGACTAFLGAAGSTLSSVFYNGTPIPMAITMSLLALAAILAAPRPTAVSA